MALSLADQPSISRPAAALRRTAARTMDMAGRNVRLTAILSVLLICACFAAAILIQMRRDTTHALAMAEAYTTADADSLAFETGRALNRLAALGTAYINAVDAASAAQMVEGADADRVINIALADADGRFITAMKGQPLLAEMLSEQVLAQAEFGNIIETYSDPAIGSSPLTLIFRADNQTPLRYIVMPIDPAALLPTRALGETALISPQGVTLALSDGWDRPPPSYALLQAEDAAPRYIEQGGETRMIALSAVPGWPLAAAASTRASDALVAWYGSIPLYLFVILGPAIAGAVLAILLVNAFERADRARAAPAAARAFQTRSGETHDPELLIRITKLENRAREAERAKSEFIIHMSHELRTPLNAIIGFAEIIQHEIFGPAGHDKYREYATDIALSGRALHDRITDILDYANVDAERTPLTLDEVDIGRIARACVDQIRGHAFHRMIEIDCDLPELPPARADAAAVKRILTILLSNALRYTPDAGEIRIEARRDEDTIVLGVHDNGLGLSMDEQAQIGQPFVRFARPGTEGGTGLGLGLAMAIGLARRMGGALRLAGAAGEGTWAELRLPIQ